MSSNKIVKLTSEKLKDIVSNSSNVMIALQKIGYTYPNSLYGKILFNRCNELGIEYKHLYCDLDKEKPCIKCGKIKSNSDFYNGRVVCKSCVKEEEKEKQHRRQEEINFYKQNKGCAKCRDKRYYVLDFHHIDPSQKDFTISDNTRIKFENLQKELDKCIILCANCHREFHFLNKNKGISLQDFLR